jgi:hypothetical protein
MDYRGCEYHYKIGPLDVCKLRNSDGEDCLCNGCDYRDRQINSEVVGVKKCQNCSSPAVYHLCDNCLCDKIFEANNSQKVKK